MTVLSTDAIYQSLDADRFADMMLDRPMVASHLTRETLGKCWNRGFESAATSSDEMRPVLACWFAAGLVEGLLWTKYGS